MKDLLNPYLDPNTHRDTVKSVSNKHMFTTNTSNSYQQTKQPCVLASNNKGKLAEFERLFQDANVNIDIISQSKLGIKDAIEDGLSFVENAIIKARHASLASGMSALADDSGLCVPLLGNAPGIYSARYGGTHADSKLNNAKLIEDLAPLREANKAIPAYFVCVLAMVRHADDPLPIIAQGIWYGEILEVELGEHGFGYDPIFWLPEYQKTAAQLDAAIKNKLSHRGKAITDLVQQIAKLRLA